LSFPTGFRHTFISPSLSHASRDSDTLPPAWYDGAASGREWLVEAHGCRPEALADLAVLRALFARMVRELGLNPVAEPQWHQFPAPGGITGLCLLAESHLSVHTFPEHGSLCLNLFCCRPRPEWPYEARLRELFGADEVVVRAVDRPYAATPAARP
jgi:S-adenosylmethionine decarboxylase